MREATRNQSHWNFFFNGIIGHEEPIAPGSSAAAPAAHTRYLSSPAGATLHGKTPGFLPRLSPKTKPMQHPFSHYNAFCSFRFQTRISRRTWQHKMTTISHYTAICNQRVKKRIELRTHEQPLIAEHRGGTNRPVGAQPHPPHTRGTFHRRPEPL